jgi:hypothetical protein
MRSLLILTSLICTFNVQLGAGHHAGPNIACPCSTGNTCHTSNDGAAHCPYYPYGGGTGFRPYGNQIYPPGYYPGLENPFYHYPPGYRNPFQPSYDFYPPSGPGNGFGPSGFRPPFYPPGFDHPFGTENPSPSTTRYRKLTQSSRIEIPRWEPV